MQCRLLLKGDTLFCHHIADTELASHSFSHRLLQHQQRTCNWHVAHNRLLPCLCLGSAKVQHCRYMLIASSMVEQVASSMIPRTSYPCLWVVFHQANFAFVLGKPNTTKQLHSPCSECPRHTLTMLATDGLCRNYAAISRKSKLQFDVLFSSLCCYQNQKLLMLDASDQSSCQVTTSRGCSRANYSQILSVDQALYLPLSACCYTNTIIQTILQCDWSFPGYKMVNPWLPRQYWISPQWLIIALLGSALGRYD